MEPRGPQKEPHVPTEPLTSLMVLFTALLVPAAAKTVLFTALMVPFTAHMVLFTAPIVF